MGFYGGGGGGGGVVGPGTADTVAKFIGANTIGDSRISDSGAGDVVFEANTGILLTSTSAIIKFGANLAENAVGYANGTGPMFFDDNNGGQQLIFNVQSLNNHRTFTWPNRSATVATTTGSLTDLRFTRIDGNGNLIQSEILTEDGTNLVPVADGVTDLGLSVLAFRQLFLDSTVTGGGTTGDQTINKASGSVNFAAAATAITVTCDKCTENSLVFAVVATNDNTAVIKNVVPGNGSFVIRLNAAATAETRVNFWVLNQ